MDSAASNITAHFALPTLCFVGRSNSGKTTLLVRLIELFTAEGLVCATVKRHNHDVDVDVPGKDSWRHAHAGARVAVMSTPHQLSVVRHTEHKASLEEIAALAADAGCEVMLVEGAKHSPAPKIEVSRAVCDREPALAPEEVVAFVSDSKERSARYRACGLPVFDPDDIEGIAIFVRELLGLNI